MLALKLIITAEIGRITLPVKNILRLDRGTVIPLDKVAGEPIELRLNNKVIAIGEIVITDDYSGIKIIEMKSGND